MRNFHVRRPQKRRYQVVVVLLGISCVAIAILFVPSIQKKLLLEQAPKFVDALTLEHVHLLPWSVTVRGLDVTVSDNRIRIENAYLRFWFIRLLQNILHVQEIRLDGVSADLISPSEKTDQLPFPGLFGSINHGLRVVVGELSIDAYLNIDKTYGVRLGIPRGQIDLDGPGFIDLDLMLENLIDKSRGTVNGTLTAKQNATAGFTALTGDLDVAIAVPNVSAPVTFNLNLALQPLMVDELAPDAAEPQKVTIGDLFELQIETPNHQNVEARFSAIGNYNGRKNALDANYAMDMEPPWFHRLIGNESVPNVAESASGRVAVDLNTLQISLDYSGDTRLTTLERLLKQNSTLPGELRFQKTLRISSDTKALSIERFRADLMAARGDALLSIVLTDGVNIVFDDPKSILNSDRELGTFHLANVPIDWFSELVPEATLRGGKIAGSFTVKSDTNALYLVPAAALSLSPTELAAADIATETVTMSAEPKLTYVDDEIAFDINNLSLRIGEKQLLQLNLSSKLPLTGDDPPISIVSSAQIDLTHVSTITALEERLRAYPLPSDLKLHYDAKLSLGRDALLVKQVGLNLTRADQALLDINTKQAFSVPFTSTGVDMPGSLPLDLQPAISGDTGGEPQDKVVDGKTARSLPIIVGTGELATVALANVELNWADPFLEGMAAKGTIERAAFSLKRHGDSDFVLAPAASTVINNLGFSKDGSALVTGLDISLRPQITVGDKTLEVAYTDLIVNEGRRRLVAGDGGVTMSLPATKATADAMSIHGRTTIQLNEILGQPALATMLEHELGPTRWAIDTNYNMSISPQQIDLSSLQVSATADDKRPVQLASKGPAIIRPSIDPKDPLAAHVRGNFVLTLKELSSSALSDLVPLGSVVFRELSGTVALGSDGNFLNADFEQPLILSGARITGKDGDIVEPFELTATGMVRTAGSALDAEIDKMSLVFANFPERPAVQGELNLRIDPQRPIPLERMEAKLEGYLPPLLSQPVLLPKHRLQDGKFQLHANIAPSGAIEATTTLDSLIAAAPLSVSTMRGIGTGAMALSGSGFVFSMPVTSSGKSGASNGLLVATFAPEKGTKAKINLTFNSKRFYLNDILAAINEIKAPQNNTEKKKKAKEQIKSKTEDVERTTPVVINNAPDEAAFWDVLPYESSLSLHINQLFYSDYVVFNEVAGQIALTEKQMGIRDLTANFHDSPLRFAGNIDFSSKSASPYDLKLEGTISEFDLNQFFTELVPGAKPRIEGLFSVSIDAFGTAPNMGQYRNNLLFDIKLKSREGLFRPLPPSSPLVIGASDALGIVGETLSYVPTGGFGAGALSRLVNYIQEIDYDRIDIHITRGDSRDIVIEKFRVKSPTIHLGASGGIDYEYGKDVLDSPLKLDAHLNMSGKGAAILYSMNLLKDEQDRFGYYKGLTFQIRGTSGNTESNFAEIVTAATEGTVKQAITRPISGLIGNIKHRWFGNNPIVEPELIPNTGDENSREPRE